MSTREIHRASSSENHAPCVTLGMAVYDGEDYVADAIESLLAQTFGDFELVISDNASTDRTQEICESYAAGDPRIRYLRQPENRGQNWNYNHLIDEARGEFFSWSDHDDVRAPTHLERCLQPLLDDPSVVWAQSECQPIDPRGELLPHETWITDETHRRLLSDKPHQRFLGALLGRNLCLDIAGVIRTSAMRSTRGMLHFWGPEKVVTTELSLRGKYVQIPETLYFYRLHPKASSALATVQEQQAVADPQGAGRRVLPRWELLKGYTTGVWRSPVSLYSRLCCQLAIFRYLLQVRKWPAILRNVLLKRGIGGRVQKKLDSLQTKKQPA